ncbi:Os07g0492400 [Oryza sativa Japonica Group]|uniref:Os07g0492400 protein n=1 Tax=Oryza sativa subsp. japonica TaxID=39947 RepID=C7J5C9_ORYSJ|nr:Os07g0492400 [Oryza sativa Japonica Group]|eukprot:NP_001175209.1 Os07g0492400 [Oryza sativa Japonica Group]
MAGGGGASSPRPPHRRRSPHRLPQRRVAAASSGPGEEAAAARIPNMEAGIKDLNDPGDQATGDATARAAITASLRAIAVTSGLSTRPDFAANLFPAYSSAGRPEPPSTRGFHFKFVILEGAGSLAVASSLVFMYARHRSVRDAPFCKLSPIASLFLPFCLLVAMKDLLMRVDEGKKLFTRMEEYSLEPNLKHYACMVNRLGRASSRGRRYDLYNANRT